MHCKGCVFHWRFWWAKRSKVDKERFVFMFVLLILIFILTVSEFPLTGHPKVPMSSKPPNNKLVLSKLELKATQGFPGCWEDHTDITAH